MERPWRAEPCDDYIGEDWETAALFCRVIEKFDRVARSSVRLKRPRSVDVERYKSGKSRPSSHYCSLRLHHDEFRAERIRA
jgi:hypothetical protein